MPQLFKDPTPTWMRDPSVLDAPWQKAVQTLMRLPILGDMIPVDPQDQVLAMGMPKTPLGRDVPEWVYKKLMSVKNPKIRDEIDRLGDIYDRATDPTHKKDLGKRMAELHRIGTGGKPFTPSAGVQAPMAPDLGAIIPDSPVIYKERLKQMGKQATQGLKRSKPKPKGKK